MNKGLAHSKLFESMPEVYSEDGVQVELEMVQQSLRKVGIKIKLTDLADLPIKDRARAEQWAIRTRWRQMVTDGENPPCPFPSGSHLKIPPLPKSVKRLIPLPKEVGQ